MSLFPGPPEQPNLPEITKTTLPLLSTVLAGFSVTIIAQLFIDSKTNLAWPPPNPGLFLGLTSLAISVPWFLTTTFFAVWGQAYNYQVLTKDIRELSNVPDDRLHQYVQELNEKWYKWHSAANTAFAIGTIAFIIGSGILFWTYIGPLAAIIFFIMIVLSLIWGRRLSKRKEKAKPSVQPPPSGQPPPSTQP